MGLFDWYKPVPDLRCPVCETVLADWQGKDGACGLFVWQQGIAYPVSQEADESNIDEADRKKFSLPEKFEFYTDCENCPDYWIVAECKTENGVCNKVENIRLDKKFRLPKKWFDQR